MCDCLVYEIETLRGPVLDVASYVLDCPIHGWRWDYVGPELTLEECAVKDKELEDAS